MKKVISLFLSVMMLLSVTTGLTFTANAAETIGSINFSVTNPVPGETVNYELVSTTANLAPWKVNGKYVNWYDVTDSSSSDKLLTSDSKFVAGHKYKAVVVTGAASGYALADTVSCDFNGTVVTGTQYKGRDKSVVQQFERIFNCDYTYISSVTLSAEAISKGDVLNSDHFVSLTPHISAMCSFTRNGESIPLGEKVTYGNYGATVILVPDKNYEFSGSVTVKMGANVFTVTKLGRGIIAKSADNLFTVNCSHSYGGLEYDATTHFKTCTQCGDKSNVETHTFSEKIVDGNTVYTCSTCGFVKTAKNYINNYYFADVEGGVQITAYTGSDVNINIPATLGGKTVVSIGDYAFSKNMTSREKFKSITVPSTVTSIGRSAFNGCSALTSVNIPSGVTRIEAETFLGCSSLGNVTIPYGVTFIGESSFQSSGISSVVIPCSVKTIKGSAFRSCVNLGSVVIPDSVTELGNAFLACSGLKTLVIGSGITSIAQAAFDGCTAVETITIPAELTAIGKYNFEAGSVKTVNYRGTQQQFNAISLASASDLKTATKNYNYTEKTDIGQHKYASAQTVAPTCVDEGYTFKMCEGCGDVVKSDVKPATGVHTYNSGVVTTPATLKENGEISYVCNDCGASKTAAIAKINSVALAKTSYAYDGKVKKPAVTVKDSKGKAVAASNYTVTYASGRKNVGRYAVKITFKNGYNGTKTLYFNIVPKGTTVSKVTSPAKKQLRVTWKKQATQTTGYQIQYSTSAKFTAKTTKTVTVKNSKTTATTIKKLTSKKKYYVRIRTYKTVSKKNYYSAWSKAKNIKVK